MTTRTRRLALSAAIIAMLCMTAVACSSEPGQDGPLDIGGGDAIDCLPLPAATLTWGNDVVTNEGDQPASITGVSLVGGRGVAISDVHVVDIYDTRLVGATAEWPPPWVDPRLLPVLREPGRLPDEVPPATDPTGDKNLVLRLEIDPALAEGAGFDRVRITYVYDGDIYTADNGNALVLKSDCEAG